ncbi:MAG: hypothetical protein RDU25_05580 [Patescibacteria group bacterium]|nr:hypothetical protein [Patescibacteria group bacterium]
MKATRDFYRHIAKAGMGVAGALMLVLSVGWSPRPAQAITVEEDPAYLPAAYAAHWNIQACQMMLNAPYGVGMASSNDCQYANIFKMRIAEGKGMLQFIVVRAMLNTLNKYVMRMSQSMAEWVLEGMHGKPSFFRQSFKDFLGDVAQDFTNRFIDGVDKEWGLGLCQPINLDFKLRIPFARLPEPPEPDCTYQKIYQNFSAVYKQLQPREVVSNLLSGIDRGANNPMELQLRINSMAVIGREEAKKSAELQRQENRGMQTATVGPLSTSIKTPALIIEQTLAESNAVKSMNEVTFSEMNTLAMSAMWAGVKQLPVIAGMTFLTTLAEGALNKLINWWFTDTSEAESNVYQVDLTNPYAQTSAEPRTGSGPKKIFTDIITPNLRGSDEINFLTEMSVCSDSRSYWNCTLDEGLANALQQGSTAGGLTVLKAAGIVANDEGLQAVLHKDWELIPVTENKDNQDPGCFQRAYCASNLAKLRFARIIPIGWELAANSPYNKKVNGKYVTLEAVVRGFSDCNDEGLADATHPWCHLISPTWVLTAPPFKCQLNGFGESLIAPSTNARLQECTDLVSCLQRDDKGNCTGAYGYCMAEKTVWRFGGDQCDEKYVSCRTYTSRDSGPHGGDALSLIRNTIDYGSCNQDNIGCMYYMTKHDVSTTTTGKWVDHGFTTKVNGVVKNIFLETSRVYFDSTVEKCDASGDGCTKVLKVNQGKPSLNLVKNSSFEYDDASAPGKLDGWKIFQDKSPYVPTVFVADSGDSSRSGSRSIEIKTSPDYQAGPYQAVLVAPLRNYALSFYARANNTSGTHKASVSLVLSKTISPSLQQSTVVSTVVGQTYFRSGACITNSANLAVSLPSFINSNNTVSAGTSQLTEEWQRFTCEFVSNADATAGRIFVGGVNAAIEDVQLEEGDKSTEYVEMLAGDLKTQYLKLPPDEFKCTGDDKSDRTECSDFARMCSQLDAGCQGYTDASGADPTEIPAILSTGDYCPNSCVGYAEYLKMPSAFDLVKTGAANPATDPLTDPNDDTTANFVPKNAEQCSADQVGCEAFTNLEAAAGGGEETIYLTYARACQKPNDKSTTYFTWEGSEATGYQLRTWSLIKETAGGPQILRKAGPDGVLKDPSGCDEQNWKDGADLDCRQIYDENGQAYYRYFSQTIVSSASCVDYRKNNQNADDCIKTGGDYRQTTNDCVYHILASESNECAMANAGCRAYLGSRGRNTANVFYEAFKDAAGNVPVYTAQSTVTLKVSTEALLVGDYSLQIQNSNTSQATTINVDFDAATGTLYTVSFWYKSTVATAKTVNVNLGPTTVGAFKASSDWKRFEIGPFKTTQAGKVTLSWVGMPNVSYLDEISIQRLQDVSYVIKGSWVIPTECDMTPEGVPQAQAMLGCREYKDRNGGYVTVRQFSRLCRYDLIGCTAFVDTQNSDDPYGQQYFLEGLPVPQDAKPWDSLYAGTVTVNKSADRFIYVVDDPAFRCDQSQMSCRAFGKQKFDNLGIPTSTIETVYLKDDITKYVDSGNEPQMLCRPSELLCDKFVSGPVTSYFRAPLEHICEWHDKVELEASSNPTYPKGEYSGWFVKDSSPPQPCYPEKLGGGHTFLGEFSGSPNYRGTTSACPADQSECTEFRDTNDHSDQSHLQGKPYYFINNQLLDKSTCNGKIDPLSGCVLFRDMNDSRLNFSTKASYAKSHAEGDVATNPVNCVSDPDSEFCKNAGSCVDIKVVNCAGNPGGTPGGYDCVTDPYVSSWLSQTQNASCSTDADCSNDTSDDHSYGFVATGRCSLNDSNIVMKVKLDRDCQAWLGCSTQETVFDPAQGKYVDLCTALSLCDQLSGTTESQFCNHYIDRKSTTTQAVLWQGSFLDHDTYADREVTFTDWDYSGYTLPNHYQIPDIQTRRMAYELMSTRLGDLQPGLTNEYRAVAAVPWSQAETYSDLKFNYLKLCKIKQTGAIGYYIEKAAGTPDYCYTAIDKAYSQLIIASINERNVQNASVAFTQDEKVKDNATLAQAFPGSTCRAYPDSAAPYPNKFVIEWDYVKDPPQPIKYQPGFDGVSLCEYGEDCDCSYRRLSYGGMYKYYAPYSGTSPSGVCIGGARNGQSCTPGAALQNQASSASTTAGNADFDGRDCGSGGACSELQSSSLIRGIFGNCLQYDYSRTLGNTQDLHPCLVWSPTPVLQGKQDVYHYQPTAGYLPPMNSGEYYCLSSAKEPRVLKAQMPNVLTEWDFSPGSPGAAGGGIKISAPVAPAVSLDKPGYLIAKAPGKMSYFWYNECFVQDPGAISDWAVPMPYNMTWNGWIGGSGDYKNWYENNCGWGSTIDGLSVRGTDSGAACGQGRNAFGAQAYAEDTLAGRWITTGRGKNRNYAEYFVEFNDKAWTEWLINKTAPTAEEIEKASLETNFTYFDFKPMYKTGAGGTWACGQSGWWVDQFPTEAGTAGWDKAGNEIVKREMAEIKRLTPQGSGYLTNEDGTRLIRLPCKDKAHSGPEGDNYCYYKYWEMGFRADGQSKFRRFNESIGGPRELKGEDVFYAESEGGKPYFAIRAMFEDTVPEDNAVAEDQSDPSGSQLAGPFKFVGWWVTASFPGLTNERYIYMYMDVGHADICKEVGSVASESAGDTAAYTDRVWDQGSYAIPSLGFNVGTTNNPFGAAKHTKKIGEEPLIMSGALDKTQYKSGANKPTFLLSGAEYFRLGEAPTGNWGWLSNIFAKIYKIYRWNEQPVTKSSWTCMSGPRQGERCPDLSKYYTGTDSGGATACNPLLDKTCSGYAVWDEGATSSAKYCGYQGDCNPDLIDLKDPSLAFCNSLSGVNAGLACGPGGGIDIGQYDVCHGGPVKNVNGKLAPQFTSCGMSDYWEQMTNSSLYSLKADPCSGISGADLTACQTEIAAIKADCVADGQNGDCKNLVRTSAAKAGAFWCADDAVHFPDGKQSWCRKPSGGKPSTDCPVEVFGSCNYSTGFCSTPGYEHVRCNEGSGCSFTWANWWYNDMSKPAGMPDKPMPYPTRHAVIPSDDLGTAFVGIFYSNTVSSPGTVNTNYPLNGAVLNNTADWAGLGNLGNLYWMDNWTSGGYELWKGTDGQSPSKDYELWKGTDGQSPSKDLAGKEFNNLRYLLHGSQGTGLDLFRFPGAFTLETVNNLKVVNKQGGTPEAADIFIPGHCEKLAVDATRCKEFALGNFPGGEADCTAQAYPPDVPYFKITGTGLTRWRGSSSSPGICELGAKEGSFCQDEKDCKPSWATDDQQWNSQFYCQPVTMVGNVPSKGTVYGTSFDCEDPDGDANTTDLDRDNNSCTHKAGYRPRVDLCGLDPKRPECLTGVSQRDSATSGSYIASFDAKKRLPPTDVTGGLHLPTYIAEQNGFSKTDYATDFTYISYYAPKPPRLAAPDTNRQCASAGQCPISTVDAFSLEGLTEGKVAYVGGQAIVTMRFYAWAADNQMGLKEMTIDWGDGTQQKLDDVRMKNKKPFCGVSKECEFVPGLTCSSDNDCPPAAGRCTDTGSCNRKPEVSCHTDQDCRAGSVGDDTCNVRVGFGSSDAACEQNYFEFTHVYTCDKSQQIDADYKCANVTGHCSRDNTRECSSSTSCAKGDTCVPNTAEPGGCFDDTNAACRYTPRVLVKDNWGWCTGECRVQDLGGGKLGPGFKDGGGVARNNILLPNGGCYDASGVYWNSDPTLSLNVAQSQNKNNMCDPENGGSFYRPWVVFKGALQLGVAP